MKIAIFEMDEGRKKWFSRFEEDHEVVYVAEALGEENAREHAGTDILSVFVASKVSASILDALGRPRLVATRSTGFDHIDLAHCERNGILVANVPRYGEDTVAEHTFALLLGLSHRLVKAASRASLGTWSWEGLQGFDLRGKTLGVVGTGGIGTCVARIGHGFGMEVIAFDLRRNEELAAQQVRYVSWHELLRQADVISLHVPLNESTRHLIGPEEFSRMKRGVILLNTSRGEIVDAVALLACLQEGRVGAAGLDVLPEEALLRDGGLRVHALRSESSGMRSLLAAELLLRHPSVLVTPHSAFYTEEAMSRLFETTVENIEAYLRGAPAHLVSPRGRAHASGARGSPC